MLGTSFQFTGIKWQTTFHVHSSRVGCAGLLSWCAEDPSRSRHTTHAAHAVTRKQRNAEEATAITESMELAENRCCAEDNAIELHTT